MTLVVTWRKVMAAVVVAVVLAVGGFGAKAVYQQHQWLHSEIGKTKEGTVVTRAMLIDALLGEKFVKPVAEAPPALPPAVPAPAEPSK